jgi:hypothetical protein
MDALPFAEQHFQLVRCNQMTIVNWERGRTHPTPAKAASIQTFLQGS